MELTGVGGSGESALDAFLTDPDLRALWFSAEERGELRALLEERTKSAPPAVRQENPFIPEAETEEEGYKEPLMRLKIAEDEMTAWVIIRDLSRDVDPDTLESMIYEILKNAGITYGIKSRQISRIVGNPLYDKPLLVAQGRRPVENQEGAITFHFKPGGSLCPIDSRNYGVDPENPDFVCYVKAETLLSTSNRTTNDFTGKTIRGRVLHPVHGGLDEIVAGENVRMSANGLEAYSLTDGEVILDGNKLSVLPVLRLDNVDVTTGDICFHGSVYVKNDVESGRTVEAAANVIVGGVVQNGIIHAGGHLAVGGGIKGAEHTSIYVGGSLRTPFVEYMNLTIGGDIYADVLFGAEVCCEGGVFTLGRRGRIVAGRCAAREITARELGNDAGARTQVEILPIKILEDKISLMQQEKDSWGVREKKMRRVVQDTENKERKLVLKRILEQIQNERKEHAVKIEALFRKIDMIRARYAMEIRVEDELHPKVTCVLGGEMLYNENALIGTRIYFAGGKIRMGAWPDR